MQIFNRLLFFYIDTKILACLEIAFGIVLAVVSLVLSIAVIKVVFFRRLIRQDLTTTLELI